MTAVLGLCSNKQQAQGIYVLLQMCHYAIQDISSADLDCCRWQSVYVCRRAYFPEKTDTGNALWYWSSRNTYSRGIQCSTKFVEYSSFHTLEPVNLFIMMFCIEGICEILGYPLWYLFEQEELQQMYVHDTVFCLY